MATAPDEAIVEDDYGSDFEEPAAAKPEPAAQSEVRSASEASPSAAQSPIATAPDEAIVEDGYASDFEEPAATKPEPAAQSEVRSASEASPSAAQSPMATAPDEAIVEDDYVRSQVGKRGFSKCSAVPYSNSAR
ncbi:unnamed protein product [Effrenium voratum]|nr:unnamed protein product [Effrenium voratum]